MAAMPEVGVPVEMFNQTADSAVKLIGALDNETTRTAIQTYGDVAKTAIPVVGNVATSAIQTYGDVAKTAIPVVGDVAKTYVGTVGNVAESAIGQTSTVLSLPMKMMSMGIGVVLIVVGVILVLIAIAVISAQSDKTAGIMIFFVGAIMAGAGGFMMYKVSSKGVGPGSSGKKGKRD